MELCDNPKQSFRTVQVAREETDWKTGIFFFFFLIFSAHEKIVLSYIYVILKCEIFDIDLFIESSDRKGN